jgi:hypothetical protein
MQLSLDGSWSTVIAERKFTRVENMPNTLSVRNEGTHFSVYVNEQLMGEADDNRLSGGRAGLALDMPVSSEERAITISGFSVYVPLTP